MVNSCPSPEAVTSETEMLNWYSTVTLQVADTSPALAVMMVSPT